MGTDRDRQGQKGLSLLISNKKTEIKQEHSQQRQNRDKTGTRRDNSVERKNGQTTQRLNRENQE
jgi:hypothetical protein